MITADTNLFVYLYDPADRLKQSAAQMVVDALAETACVVPLQLVGELQNVLRRKLKVPPATAAAVAREVLSSFDTFPASRRAAESALFELASGRLSYWDALMLASAREAGCKAMLTEDLQDGARLFGIEIVNPFGAHGPSARAAELLGLQ